MIKAIAIAAALALTSVGAQAAEVGVRHSTGGSHTNTHSGRQWHNYEGSSQNFEEFSGQASTVDRSNGSLNIGGNASGDFGVGYGQPDEGDGRGASCERGRASFCNASTDTSVVDRASSEYSGWRRGSETYDGGTKSRFNGHAWSSFSETSTFAR